MNLAESAYDMPTGMLLHEAGKQFAMAEIVRDGWQQVLYERGGWFLLLVHAERTCGVPETQGAKAGYPEHDIDGGVPVGVLVCAICAGTVERGKCDTCGRINPPAHEEATDGLEDKKNG